tara:strand:- start:1401 stop:2135 length:735 start_codon:yes stop_codon:yes gene_type:complete
MSQYKLIGVGTNAKTIKGDGSEYLTGIVYMTPYKVMVDNKWYNSCSMAVLAGCIEGCLNTAGRGAMNCVQAARQRKAEWFYRDRDGFMRQLITDLKRFVAYCKKRGIQPVIRLNGTTDIRWELITIDGLTIFEHFPEISYYDYTKIANRNTDHIPNYHLTWSYSNASPKYAAMMQTALDRGMNVATVFRKAFDYANTWAGLPVINGDADDLRILDPKGGHIVALYAKGKAKKDTSGFVVDVAAA